METVPFRKSNISYVFKKIKDNVMRDVANLDDITSSDVEDSQSTLIEKYSLKTFELHEQGIHREHSEINRNVTRLSDIRTVLFVPIKGNNDLLEYCPSTYRLLKNYASVQNGGISYTYMSSAENAASVSNSFKQDLEDLRFNIENINKDINTFNSHLSDFIKELLQKRAVQIEKNKQFVESFKYPLRSDSTAKRFYEVPVKKKELDINKFVGNKVQKPEYFLSDSDYNSILAVIHDMSLVFERSPKAFQEMEEEVLRFMLLIPLNGLFPGAATGETFNYEGQTDILIRYKGKNIFIAECKFWTGEKGLLDAIDQILGYVSWRDTKTAIVLFNRNKNLTSVLNQIPKVVRKHSSFENQLEWDKCETATRYQFHHRDDISRELTLSILVFDVPKHD